MWRRQRIAPEAVHTEEREEVQEAPPESRRTRSGRRVRTPAALLDSEEPPRTPSRRTRRTVLQVLAVQETNTEEPEEISHVSAAPEPCTVEDPAGEHVPRPAETGSDTVPETVPKKKARLAPSGNQKPVVPLGKPKSGRVWKERSKQRFSALVRDKPLCSSWEKKMQEKREKELVRRFSLQLKEDKARAKEEKRKRREDNLKRRTENERKSEIVQVIRNTAKIKRMKKKQLRRIEKRDTLALLQRTQNMKAKGQKKTDRD